MLLVCNTSRQHPDALGSAPPVGKVASRHVVVAAVMGVLTPTACGGR
jgi:hypothetical protein